MSTTTLERIIEEVRSLTPEERRELFLRLEKDERTAGLRRIQEKYSRSGVSTEAFSAIKAEEIELEDRPRQ